VTSWLIRSALLSATCTSLVLAQAPGELRRRADWGAALAHTPDSGAVVRRVTDGSAASRGGLRVGDRVIAIGNTDVRRAAAYQEARRSLRGGDEASLRVVRGGDTVAIRFTLPPLALERLAGVALTYGSVASPRGYRVRTVVSRPTSAGNARLPTILFVPWLSCDPVEKPDPGTDGFAHMLRGVSARSGMMVMRVEKPGVGDSEGPDCSTTELDDDLAALRAALAALRSRADVDTSRIYVLGGSIGGGLAPILAAEDPRGIAGVIAVNGVTRTWYEHMLDIERTILELRGSAPSEVNAAMRGIARLYVDYLLDARTPAEVLRARPELRPLWSDEPEHQYGRRSSYYHAVQRLDIEGAWAALAARGVPALVLWGEYDWIMSRAEADRAVEIVNGARPGSATLIVLPRTSHGLMTHPTMRASFAGENPVWASAPVDAIVAWLRARRPTG
jgi:pimeloyl-ACP methyl ester carboxylesterase